MNLDVTFGYFVFTSSFGKNKSSHREVQKALTIRLLRLSNPTWAKSKTSDLKSSPEFPQQWLPLKIEMSPGCVQKEDSG